MSKKIDITYTRKELIPCPICHGKGTTGEGVFRARCINCGGTGKIRV